MSTTTREAGRELDALIAEQIFGAVVDGERSSVDPYAADTWITTPHYSTDIAAAMLVVEHMNGYSCDLTIEKAGRAWYVDFRVCYGEADTLPLAICRAALACTDA